MRRRRRETSLVSGRVAGRAQTGELRPLESDSGIAVERMAYCPKEAAAWMPTRTTTRIAMARTAETSITASTAPSLKGCLSVWVKTISWNFMACGAGVQRASRVVPGAEREYRVWSSWPCGQDFSLEPEGQRASALRRGARGK
jgi:hypothetical protein